MKYLDWYLNIASATIYAWIPLFVVIWFFFKLLKKVSSEKTGYIICGFLGLVILLTLPSYDRYSFQSNTKSLYKNKPYFLLVDYARYSALVEPITLINTPIGFFHYISPIGDPTISYDFNRSSNTFVSNIHNFNKENDFRLITTNCDKRMLEVSKAIEDVYKIIDKRKMVFNEEEIFCKTDYNKEKDIWYCIFNKVKNINKEKFTSQEEQELIEECS